MADEVIDQIARDAARDAVHDIRNFRTVTDIQFKNLDTKLDTTHKETNEKIGRIESAIKWAGGLVVSLVLTVLGWAVLQQINANDAQKKDMAQQIQLLQQQERARVEARTEILSRLPARASESSGTADRLGQDGDLRDMRPNNRGQN